MYSEIPGQKCRLDLPLLESSRKKADKSFSFKICKITESDGLERGSADKCSALKKKICVLLIHLKFFTEESVLLLALQTTLDVKYLFHLVANLPRKSGSVPNENPKRLITDTLPKSSSSFQSGKKITPTCVITSITTPSVRERPGSPPNPLGFLLFCW